MHEIVSLNVWSRIQLVSHESRRRTAAIAYVTTDTHVQFGDGDVLVTDASDNAIACGQTSAKVLEAAMARRAKLYSCDGLHAKVIVFDTVAMIGSSNLSRSSERDLVEASWLTDDPIVVAEVRTFVERLAAQSDPVSPERLAQILSIKVKRRPGPVSKRDKALGLEDSSHGKSSAVSFDIADEEIAMVLSRPRKNDEKTWLPDPRLVLMTRDDVYDRMRLRKKKIAQKVWVRKEELGTNRESPRTIPRPYHQNLIDAALDLAKAKGSAPTRDEILALVVLRHNADKLPNTKGKRSEGLRKDPFEYFGTHFDPTIEESDYEGGTLRYFVRATTERQKVFFRGLDVKRK